MLDLLHEIQGTDIRLIDSILASALEMEWDQALKLRERYKDEQHVVEAGKLVAEYFSALDHLGMIRMRESPYCRYELQLDEFISALRELFPVNNARK